MKKLLGMSLILSMSFSCNNINVQKKNRENDKVEAEKVLNIYFDNVLANRKEKNLQLFSKAFFEKSPKDVFFKQHNAMDERIQRRFFGGSPVACQSEHRKRFFVGIPKQWRYVCLSARYA